MKKVLSMLIILAMVGSIASCGSSVDASELQSTESSSVSEKESIVQETKSNSEESSSVPEDEKSEEDHSSDESKAGSEEESSGNESAEESSEEDIDDTAWDELASLGKVETENGIFVVTITVPAEMVGETTQEELDKEVGEKYLSAVLNENGSVTYKMTKAQHRKMLDQFADSIDEGLLELTDSADYTFTAIEHNEDFTHFDVTLSADEAGFAETYMVMVFYMYGGLYGLFSGHEGENISVTYYNAAGEEIFTGNSSEMGE